MKTKFQETYDQIKAPEELKKRVLVKIKEPQKKTEPVPAASPKSPIKRKWKYAGLAAAAVLLCFTAFRLWNGNPIYKTPLKDGEYLRVVELQNGYLQFVENNTIIVLTPNVGAIGKEEAERMEPDSRVIPIEGQGKITVEKWQGKGIKPMPEEFRSHIGQQELVLTVLDNKGEKTFEAEYEKAGILYHISGERVTQKQFIDFLIEELKDENPMK